MFATIIYSTIYRQGSYPPDKPFSDLWIPLTSLGLRSDSWDDDWPANKDTGLLTCDVFVIDSLHEIAPHSDHWLEKFLAESDHDDLTRAAPAICKIMEQARAKVKDTQAEFPCEFIGLWSVKESTDWETGIVELDEVNFAGEGQVVPITPMPPTSLARTYLKPFNHSPMNTPPTQPTRGYHLNQIRSIQKIFAIAATTPSHIADVFVSFSPNRHMLIVTIYSRGFEPHIPPSFEVNLNLNSITPGHARKFTKYILDYIAAIVPATPH